MDSLWRHFKISSKDTKRESGIRTWSSEFCSKNADEMKLACIVSSNICCTLVADLLF